MIEVAFYCKSCNSIPILQYACISDIFRDIHKHGMLRGHYVSEKIMLMYRCCDCYKLVIDFQQDRNQCPNIEENLFSDPDDRSFYFVCTTCLAQYNIPLPYSSHCEKLKPVKEKSFFGKNNCEYVLCYNIHGNPIQCEYILFRKKYRNDRLIRNDPVLFSGDWKELLRLQTHLDLSEVLKLQRFCFHHFI